MLINNPMEKDGIWSGISNADYHADNARISCSGIKKIVGQSPLHFKEWRTEESAAMALGSASHCFILEGEELFYEQFAVAPKCDKRTNIGKANWARFLAESDGKTPVEEKDFHTIEAMANSIERHGEASRLLQSGIAEQSVLWADPATGLMCKCRPDWLRHDGIIVDLKTTTNATMWPFRSSMRKYGYDIQDAFYSRGLAAVGRPAEFFVFVAVETTHPYAVGIYTFDRPTIDAANAKVDAGLGILKSCMLSGEWPGPNNDEWATVSLVGQVEVADIL